MNHSIQRNVTNVRCYWKAILERKQSQKGPRVGWSSDSSTASALGVWVYSSPTCTPQQGSKMKGLMMAFS